MNPLWILAVGIAIVLGGVLLLRLHAFLALVLAALVVGLLTPAAYVERHVIEAGDVAIDSIDPAASEVSLWLDAKHGARVGMRYLVLREEATTGSLEPIAELEIDRFVAADETETEFRSVAKVLGADVPLQTTDIVAHPLAWEAAQKVAEQTVGQRVANGFGSTCAKIGILIALAAIIGKCLLNSGAADRIVRSAVALFGQRSAPLAFLSSGFLLGIPVFFDTVFYLMIPLGKAMWMRTRHSYLLYVLTIVAGASMAHSLVPPTPGPLFVAEELGVGIGTMILAGCVVGFFTSGTGYLYARLVNRLCELPLRASADFSLEDIEALSKRDESQLPPFGLAVLPVILPVMLIGGFTVLDMFADHLPAELMRVAKTLGNKNIALAISAAIAMATLVWQKRTSRQELAASVQAALASGGVIILITAGGGAFGPAIQQTGVSSLIRQLPQSSPLLVIALAFLITTAVRTAQGSGTVAMITAVGILSGIASSEGLGFDPVYLALAIGCGSKPIAWMNDSGFWVICKMSGMTESEGLKFVTPMSILMGLVGLGVTMLGAWLIPFPFTSMSSLAGGG